MNASKRTIGSDLAKVDAHAITDEEYRETPELSRAAFNRGTIMRNGQPARRGRPRLESQKKMVTLRLEADVMERLRAAGAGWQRRANDRLRKALQLERPG